MIREVAVAEYQARRFWSIKEPVGVQVRDANARGGGTAHHRGGVGARRQLQQHVQSRRDSATTPTRPPREVLALLAYSPQLGGSYARPDRPLPAAYAHAGSLERLAVLGEVASEQGATPAQGVLAWLLARSEPPIIPIPGAGTVAQLDEILAATELPLAPETISRLDLAGRPVTAAAAR